MSGGRSQPALTPGGTREKASAQRVLLLATVATLSGSGQERCEILAPCRKRWSRSSGHFSRRPTLERATYRGFDGLRSAWIDWLEPWESYRSEVEEIVDLGDRVAVLVHDFGRRKGMEREVETHAVAMYAFRGDKISRIEFHFDREEGITAVGLRDRGY